MGCGPLARRQRVHACSPCVCLVPGPGPLLGAVLPTDQHATHALADTGPECAQPRPGPCGTDGPARGCQLGGPGHAICHWVEPGAEGKPGGALGGVGGGGTCVLPACRLHWLAALACTPSLLAFCSYFLLLWRARARTQAHTAARMHARRWHLSRRVWQRSATSPRCRRCARLACRPSSLAWKR